MDFSFPDFVDKQGISIKVDEELQLRYFITIPIKYNRYVPDKKVLVILKNPSEAIVDHSKGLYLSDQTANRVLSYFQDKNYTEVTIVNLFARFFKESEKLNDFVYKSNLIIGPENDKYIEQFIKSGNFERIVIAWGGYPKKPSSEMKKIYLERIKAVKALIANNSAYYVESLSGKENFPKHGMIWSLSSPMFKYIY